MKMGAKSELDLVGVMSPVCLLKCKSCLRTMRPGEEMDVLVQDPEVVDELVKIVERSADEVVHRRKERDYYRICIRKG